MSELDVDYESDLGKFSSEFEKLVQSSNLSFQEVQVTNTARNILNELKGVQLPQGSIELVLNELRHDLANEQAVLRLSERLGREVAPDLQEKYAWRRKGIDFLRFYLNSVSEIVSSDRIPEDILKECLNKVLNED